MTSAFTLLATTPVNAQLAAEQPVSGPLPVGVTPDITVAATAY